MEIKINLILVENRKRKLNIEKVAGLADSFALIGQLEPITVTLDNEHYVLLAGWHRLEAAKSLGWETVKAEIFQGDELECELVEIDENLTNHDLTVLEQSVQLKRRNEILEAMGTRATTKDNQHTLSDHDTVSRSPKTTEDIAKEVGLSKRSTQRRLQIARDLSPEAKELIQDTPIADSTTQLLELARLEPTEQVEAAQQIVGGKKTVKDYIREKNRQKKAKEVAEKTTGSIDGIGKFPVIYADPPWQYDFSKSNNREIENQYPTMSLENICNLNVSEVANDDCVLFLWATSPKLVEALKVIESWGFEYKTCMVWVKDKIGMGYYARQQHELLLIATKGSLPTPEPSVRPSSVINANRGQHSKKPIKVYAILENMYTDYPKVELFARERREGWETWGNEL